MAMVSLNNVLVDAQLRVLAIAYAAAASVMLVVLAAIALFGNAESGSPRILLALNLADTTRATPSSTSGAPDARQSLTALSPPQSAPAQPAPPPKNPPASVHAAVPTGNAVYAGRNLVADPALIEQTSDGPLPKVGENGRTPMAAYAGSAPAAGRMKIALVISGLGFSARETGAALARLPAAVTLAFAPYAGDAQRWVAEARRQGHEVLVEVPMEPYDFPDSDPGPHTLRAGVDADANTQRLIWALTRFTGYTGVTNLLGSRLLSDRDSLTPVLTFLTHRGLLFYDGGSGSHSLAPQVARSAGTPFAQASVEIDRIQTAMEIDQRLAELESRARTGGSAGGTGYVYPVTLDRVSLWAQSLSDRGFVLVPASAIVARPN